MVQLLVNVDVDDLQKAIEFYCSALDLTLKRRLFNDTVAEMVGASSQLYLLKKPAGSVPSPALKTVRDYGRHWTPVHLDVVVDELGPAIQRAQTAGAVLESDVQTYDWGCIAFMADPFGHGFCLLEFRDGGYDAT
jgi:predicted enzyme related to lactoylglutathione lyase